MTTIKSGEKETERDRRSDLKRGGDSGRGSGVQGDPRARRIGVVTVGRSDYGIYRTILKAIEQDPDLELRLIVSGSHLSPELGYTFKAIEADGFQVDERVEMLLSSESPEGIAKSVGLGVIGFAQCLNRLRPDILLLLGDRFEMHAAALAALPFKIPIAHIHGGELTEGAFDDALRHSLTKLSHIHFVATEDYARRVAQLGEEPWRITLSGAPVLDNLESLELVGYHELESKYAFDLTRSCLLVTFHPVTLEYERTEWQITQLLVALKSANMPVVFTGPNEDTHHGIIRRTIEEYAAQNASAWIVDNLGTRDYFSLMAAAGAMVGNSSSGIIEAGSFKLPVVNVGNRQRGRVRGPNVIDVGYNHEEILRGIKKAVRPQFRASIKHMTNPYGRGNATAKIIARLKEISLDRQLICKRFYDIDIDANSPMRASRQ